MNSTEADVIERCPFEILGFAPASAPGRGQSWLSTYGDQVKWIPSRFSESNYHGFSASDPDRLTELTELLGFSAFMMATRGGWGCLRLLHKLPFHRNWHGVLMGFSDLTALLNTLPFYTKVACFHGPMYEYPAQICTGGFLAKSFEDFFLRKQSQTTGRFKGRIRGQTKLKGPLIGGNLSVFIALAGTPFMPDLKGKVLFLEEIKEPTYRVDRMLTQLSYLPGFEALNGLVIGSFSQCNPSPQESGDFCMQELLDDFYCRTQIPMLEGAPIGHVDDFLILPMMGDSHWLEDSGVIHFTLSLPNCSGEADE